MNNVKSYTDEQILKRVKELKNYKSIPETYWICAIRSSEDETDKFDDKVYLFYGEKFISVTSCTTNKGNKGTGVVEADVWNYGAYSVGRHKGKALAGVQRIGFPYRRDFTTDGKTNATTEIMNDIRGFNFHAASHDLTQKVIKTNIGGWSEGCIVCNDIQAFSKIMTKLQPQKVFSMVILNEF
jgi:hypothetical protein